MVIRLSISIKCYLDFYSYGLSLLLRWFTIAYFVKNEWSVVYERAIRDDGSLLFPERLSREFLESVRKSQGSYIFANQYQNEIIPEEEKCFKSHWMRYYGPIPDITYRFAFIDPAIGQKSHNDYTGVAIVDVDPEGTWYLRVASRYRLTPTQIVEKVFDIQNEFKCNAIGVESVAYQEALLYILDEEMRRKQVILPVKGIKRSNQSKQSRILGLVPRFEWGRIYLARGLTDFEDEISTFPRGSHDDILDSLASLEELVFYPQKENKNAVQTPHPGSHDYEKWFIRQLSEGRDPRSISADRNSSHGD